MSYYAGRSFDLESFEVVKTDEFTNFRFLYLAIKAKDQESGEIVDLEIEPIIAERNGRFAFVSYDYDG